MERKAQKGGGQRKETYSTKSFNPSSLQATSAPAMLHSKVTPSCGVPTVGPSTTLISTAPCLEYSPSPSFFRLFFLPLKQCLGVGWWGLFWAFTSASAYFQAVYAFEVTEPRGTRDDWRRESVNRPFPFAAPVPHLHKCQIIRHQGILFGGLFDS